MKVTKEYLYRQIKHIIKEQVDLEVINAELSKTSITDPEIFNDPAVIMEKFNTIFEIAGIIYDNQIIIKNKISELEVLIDTLEKSS
jgi:hypothetical protein